MARAAPTCNYDNMRGSSCLHIVSAHPTSKRATQACRRTNAVAVGPVNMMCKLTLTLTNDNAIFSARQREVTPIASQDATACRNCAPAHSARLTRRNCMPRLQPAASRNCCYQLTLAKHLVTCVGLRKRRARGRSKPQLQAIASM